MGLTWGRSAPDGLHVGPMNLAIRGYTVSFAGYAASSVFLIFWLFLLRFLLDGWRLHMLFLLIFFLPWSRIILVVAEMLYFLSWHYIFFTKMSIYSGLYTFFSIFSIPSNFKLWISLRWRHNERNGFSNHQPHDHLLNRLFGRRSKKTSKLRVTGLCEGNSPVTGEFPAQRASNAENVSVWWRHHGFLPRCGSLRGLRCLPHWFVLHVGVWGALLTTDIRWSSSAFFSLFSSSWHFGLFRLYICLCIQLCLRFWSNALLWC